MTITAEHKSKANRHAKNIVLHLSKYRNREWTRAQVREALNLEMPEKALVKTDIINQGASNNRYRGVNDNIFDKVFRGVYEEDIREFDPKVIREEYSDELKKERKPSRWSEGPSAAALAEGLDPHKTFICKISEFSQLNRSTICATRFPSPLAFFKK